MKVIIGLPRESEGKVRVNERDGEIVIQPRFQRVDANRALLYVQVCSDQDDNQPKHFVIMVSGATGQITAQEAKNMVPLFDRPLPSDPTERPLDGSDPAGGDDE